MAEIIVFRSNEIPKLNYPEIEVLLEGLGVEQGLRVFERVLFKISNKLCQLELAVFEGDIQTAKRTARSLRTLSPQVGLACLADVANDVVDVILSGNLNALPAISHRLLCLGEASLFQMAKLPRVLEDQ